MDLSKTDTRAIAVVGAVSREKGIECLMTFKESITISKFKVFLEELRNCNPFDNILLVMDNLAVHKSNHVKDRMEELGFKWAWTPAYSPQYNGGIEETWSMAKKIIKAKRLNLILNN